MNKLIVGSVLASLISLQAVNAGDREWATVGKVLTGVVAIEAVGRIINPPPQVVYVQPQQVVYTQPVVVQTAPVVYQPAPVVYVQPQPAVVVYGAWGRPVHHHHHHRVCR